MEVSAKSSSTRPMTVAVLGLLVMLLSYGVLVALGFEHGTVLGRASPLAKGIVLAVAITVATMIGAAEAVRKKVVASIRDAVSSKRSLQEVLIAMLSVRVLAISLLAAVATELNLRAISVFIPGVVSERNAEVLELEGFSGNVRTMCARSATVRVETWRQSARLCVQTSFGASLEFEGVRVGSSISLRIRTTPFYAIVEGLGSSRLS